MMRSAEGIGYTCELSFLSFFLHILMAECFMTDEVNGE